MIGAAVLGLVVLTGLYVWRQQSKKTIFGATRYMIHKTHNISQGSKEAVYSYILMIAELYSIVGKPNVFIYKYGELKIATENFSSNNLLGEGGYGSVYKVSSSKVHMDLKFTMKFYH